MLRIACVEGKYFETHAYLNKWLFYFHSWVMIGSRILDLNAVTLVTSLTDTGIMFLLAKAVHIYLADLGVLTTVLNLWIISPLFWEKEHSITQREHVSCRLLIAACPVEWCSLCDVVGSMDKGSSCQNVGKLGLPFTVFIWDTWGYATYCRCFLDKFQSTVLGRPSLCLGLLFPDCG